MNWAATPGLPYYVLLALQKYAGIRMVQVGYREFAPAYQDLNQGRLHVAGTGVPTLVPHHRAGTAKLLFVTNRDRSPQATDVPTAREAGYPDLTFEGTSGIFGWRDMPPDIKQRIVNDVRGDHRRSRVSRSRAQCRDRTAQRIAGGIRGRDRRATRQDRGDSRGDRQARA